MSPQDQPMANPTLSLPQLIEHLEDIEESAIGLDLVSDLMARTEISRAHLQPLVNFRKEKYTRNLIHRTDLFDVMILCWPKNKISPVHDHCDQLGWVRVLRGALQETRYCLGEGQSMPKEGAPCELEATSQLVQCAGELVSGVERAQGIHSLGTLEEDAVSLHVYSKPHDRCRMFCTEGGPVKWRNLRFDFTPDWRAATRGEDVPRSVSPR